MSDKKVLEVVAAVICKDNKILAAQRGYGEFIDKWEFPGGKVENGESLKDALHREIKEELGNEIIIKSRITSIEYEYDNFILKMHCFLSELVSSDFSLNEHKNYRWVNIDDIDELDWLPADRSIISDVKPHLISVKEEYESLNGKSRKENCIFQTIEIDDSVIDNSSIKEALNIFHDSAESLLYFGANWCPWCRNVLPILVEYAKANNLRITYVNLDKKRPVYSMDNNEIILTDKGDKDFELLTKEFNEIMQDYIIKKDDEDIILKDKLTIYIPLVVFGSFGNIIGYHYGGVDLNQGQTPYDLFDEKQKKELLEIFESKNIVEGITCDIHGCSR